MKELHCLLLSVLCLLAQSCNYHYYRGSILEREGRFEEANIEFHRAYTRSPNNRDFQDAYLRTSAATAADLMRRYRKYLEEKKYHLAFHRLEQARVLMPRDPEINLEKKKWYRILIAGRIDFTFHSLRNRVPLADEMVLQVRINTFHPNRSLTAAIDNRTRVFSVEDVLYDPPQNILMFYTLNSIGVHLSNKSRFLGNRTDGTAIAKLKGAISSDRFQKFVDFRTPALVKIRGRLKTEDKPLLPVEDMYPKDAIRKANSMQYAYPSREIRYSLMLDGNGINVESSEGHISFLPQILYMNRKNRRFFLDFGHIELLQSRAGGLWKIKRIVSDTRPYMEDLKKNLLLNPYFFFREGGYPFRLAESS